MTTAKATIDSDRSFNDAIHLHQLGELKKATHVYQRILDSAPNHAGAMHLLGVVRHQQGEHETAIQLIGRAIVLNPRNAVYRNNYGIALHSLGRFAEAIDSVRSALEIQPQYVQALANLGMAQQSLGQHEAAMASFHDALRIEPYHADAMIKLAVLLEQLGRRQEAIHLYEDGIRHAPCLHFYVNLGALVLGSGHPEEAIQPLERATAIAPDCARAHFNLGGAYQQCNRTSEGRRSFTRAADLCPEQPLWRLRPLLCATPVFASSEAIDAYRDELSRALSARPEIAPATVDWNTLLQANVFPSFAISYHGRDSRRLKERFAAIYEPYFRGQQSPSGEPLDCAGVPPLGGIILAMPPTTWCPGGMPDCAGVPPGHHVLMVGGIATLMPPKGGTPARGTPASPRNRKRIGFVVTRRHEGIFLRCMAGIIENLNSERFEIVLCCCRRIVETLKNGIRREGITFVPIDDSLPEAVSMIRAAACDLIYFWEVGSDAINYLLPFARLAPVQCTSHGLLTTTGIAEIDYFYSSDLMETSAADEHYTERLWRARGLLMCRPRLPPIEKQPRSRWGLPENAHLYVCFQNPLKLHPDFDRLMAGILASDPAGLIVLLADQYGPVTQAVKQRFARSMHKPSPLPLSRVRARGAMCLCPHALPISPKTMYPWSRARGARREMADRIIFLPRQEFGDYCALLQAADVVLDPLHYGAGSSCYDVFSFNLPMVTMPTELMPGRVCYGFYKRMQFEDLIASSPDDYVRKAVQVATDRDYRNYVTQRIAQASDLLFNDTDAVREHERFFEEANQAAQRQI